jgi:hypothetical protein
MERDHVNHVPCAGIPQTDEQLQAFASQETLCSMKSIKQLRQLWADCYSSSNTVKITSDLHDKFCE